MCGVILDNDVVAQVFSKKQQGRPPAGVEFHKAIHDGLSLIAGGHLLKELDRNTTFREWRAVASKVGRVRIVPTAGVDLLTDALKKAKACVSNDEHVIALAQISGARLLYSNDKDLHSDFTNKTLVDGPRGKIYTTRKKLDFTATHRQLLEAPPSCADPRR